MSQRQPRLSARLQGLGTTVFTEMTELAKRHDAVNLGQGFPDFEGPEVVREAAVDALRSGQNQYCRMFGVPELNRAIAAHQQRFRDLRYDPDREITVTSGATEAIFSTIQALCDVGDEVVAFEPFYDSYRAVAAMAGARTRWVPLRDPDFRFDPEELDRAIGARTRAILVNTPHNPTGRVFDRGELETIARLCRERDVVAIADEVYEHLVFDGEHVSLAGLEGMWDRTVTISSAGKTFSFTGWKVGWACAPPDLTAAIRTAHQFVTFCNSAPLQPAIAVALGLDDGFYRELRDGYRERRDLLCAGLAEVGFVPRVPEGTYFALADARPLGFADDAELCRTLPERVGVAAIPTTAFTSAKRPWSHLVRMAFCKSLPVLEEGVRRLRGLGGSEGGGSEGGGAGR